MTDEIVEEIQEPTSLLNNEEPSLDRPEWLLDKYVTEDRSQEDSISEQAKAYNEAQKMLGGFIGAPEEYAFAMPEGIEGDVDVELEAYKSFVDLAKNTNMSQDTAQELYSIFANYQNSQLQQNDIDINTEMELLGPDAGRRLQALGGWGQNNLSPEENATLESMTTNSGQVQLIEKLVSMSKSTPLPSTNGDTPLKAGYSKEDFESDIKDDRYYSDPNFRKQAIKKAENAGI